MVALLLKSVADRGWCTDVALTIVMAGGGGGCDALFCCESVAPAPVAVGFGVDVIVGGFRGLKVGVKI